jgi:tRNA pseudouridine38-40 synthase
MHAEPSTGARRVALLLEYDGTAYRGSQYQENAPTIQASLEAAIRDLTHEDVRVAFAGRTDAGVHALGQVAAFDTHSGLTPGELRAGLNHFLPADVTVVAARDTYVRFDPRRDAVSRAYRYVIVNRRARPALARDRAWHVPQRLDVDAMREAAAILEGRHDFAAFAGAYDGDTVRTLRACRVHSGCDRVTLDFEAQAFLPHQVRRTVGPLVEVGLGRMRVEDVGRLLREPRPSTAGPAAPPCGLYLVRVTYDGFAFEPAEEDGTEA